MHFGLKGKLEDQPLNVVGALDLIVGNTLVMWDSGSEGAKRRRNYGRAGEYRMPEYGVEYRTPSNFWLRSPVLMSMAFGLAQIALAIVESGQGSELAELVSLQDFIKAIDDNDFYLAVRNWRSIKEWVRSVLPRTGFVLCPANVEKFERVTLAVWSKGIDSFFPEPPLVAWRKPKVSFDQWLARI
jgi:hypothetical protein